jgi:flagellar basal body-associated protein FliL
MNLSLSKKLLIVTLVLPLAGAVVGYSPLSIGQEKPAAKKEEAKPKGRLPAYYSDVVTEAQRTTIYSIQAKYEKELKALNEQLAATIKKQNDEIAAVLSDEQKAKVEAARTAANDKKKKKAADGEKKAGS